MGLSLKSEQALGQELLTQFLARTDLNDLRIAGRMVQFAVGMANQLFRLQNKMYELQESYFLSKATGADLLVRFYEIMPEGTVLSTGLRAAGGQVVFSRGAGLSSTIIIPMGTVVKNPVTGITYRTAATVMIGSDLTDSPPVTVVCDRVGDVGNCIAGDISGMTQAIAGVTSVANTSSIQNGKNAPTDPEIRNLIYDYIKGISRATPTALIRAVLNLSDPAYGQIRYAKCLPVDPARPGLVDLVVDDGAGLAASVDTVPAGTTVLSSSSGGENYLYLPAYPVVPGGSVQLVFSSGAVPYRVIKPWGLVVLSSPLGPGITVSVHAYQYFTGLVALAQKVIDGDPENPLVLPGYRAAGNIVSVRGASLVHPSISGDIVFQPDVKDIDGAKADLRAAAVSLVNNSDIGLPLLRARIEALWMADPRVFNVMNILIGGQPRDYYVGADVAIRITDNAITI